MTLDPAAIVALRQAAQRVAVHAYAPYSQFRVGAAVLGEQGTYLGTNCENAINGLSICAEMSALAAAIAAGDRNVLAIAVACIDAHPSSPLEQLTPCGACRQWLCELAPQAPIYIAGHDAVLALEDLLPLAFRLPQ